MADNVIDPEFLRRRLAQIEGSAKAESTAPLHGGGGGGTFDGMEARVAKLEKSFDKIDGKLDSLIKEVAEMKGRVSAMPTTWQLIGLVLGIMAATLAIVRFGIGKV